MHSLRTLLSREERISKQAFSFETKSLKSKKSIRSRRSKQQTKTKEWQKQWQRQRQWQRQSRRRQRECWKISQIVNRHDFRNAVDNECHVRSDYFLNFEQCMFSAQHSKEIDVYLVHNLHQIDFDQRFREINLHHETKNNSCDLQNRQQMNEHFLFWRFLRFEVLFEFNQFWSVRRDSLLHVVQKFIHDWESRHHNKEARQQRVFFLSCESMWIINSSSHLTSIISSNSSSSHVFQSKRKFWTYNTLD